MADLPALTVIVAVAGGMTVEGVTEQMKSPVVQEDDKLTGVAGLPCGEMVNVKFVLLPGLTIALLGAELRVKSVASTFKVINAECSSEPAIPTVPMRYSSGGVREVVLRVRVEVTGVPPGVSIGGLKEQFPPAGKTEHVNATAPTKPLMGATVIVKTAGFPGITETKLGNASIVKSGVRTLTGVWNAAACITQLLTLFVKVAVASTPDNLTVVIWCSAVSPFTVCAVVTKLPPGPVKNVSVVPAPIITSLAVDVLTGPLSAFFPTPL
jgi:hypothetical protein